MLSQHFAIHCVGQGQRVTVVEEKKWNHSSDQVISTSQILQAGGYALSASHAQCPCAFRTWNNCVLGIGHGTHSKGKRKGFLVIVVLWLVGFFVVYFWVSTAMSRSLQSVHLRKTRGAGFILQVYSLISHTLHTTCLEIPYIIDTEKGYIPTGG